MSTESHRRGRVRGRAVVGAAVIALVGGGLAVGLVNANDGTHDRTASENAPANTTTTTTTTATTTTATTTTATMSIPNDPAAVEVILSLSFVDANVGFGLSYRGGGPQRDLVRSGDGGRTWRRIAPVAQTSVQFVNASDGVAYGDGGMKFTRDGGVHWSPIEEPIKSVVGVADGRMWGFFDCQSACRVLSPGISDDGGRTWHPVATRVRARQISAFVATSRFTAYALVVAGTSDEPLLQLATTHDSGAMWRYDPAPCSPYDYHYLARTKESLLLVCGGAHFSGALQDKRVFVSTDRGRSWKREGASPGAGNVQQVTSFGSVYLAELGRAGGAISSDSGHSWNSPGFPNGFDDGGVGFDPLPGIGVWAAKGGSGGLWFSTDGLHWEKRAEGYRAES